MRLFSESAATEWVVCEFEGGGPRELSISAQRSMASSAKELEHYGQVNDVVSNPWKDD
jgi:hypothetical protein